MSSQRHEINPFLNEMVIHKKSQQVTVSALGKDGNTIIVNPDTGEVNGTHVVTYKQVDDAEFIKLFSANIGLTFDLKSAGIKSLNVLIWSIQSTAMNKDLILLDSYALEEFNQKHIKTLSLTTFKRGLSELEGAKIIAKAVRMGPYSINPHFAFNGNRIAFTTAIERKSQTVNKEIESSEE
jgi:hypothetical protein